MGCCFSNDDDDRAKDNDVNERTRLLRNPATNASNNRPVSSDDFNGTPPGVTKGDEQTALNRILQQTASDVIDVSALDSQSMEQHEYLDKSRQYNSRLASLSSALYSRPKKHNLPTGTQVPQGVLASDLISLSDINMISDASIKTAEAVNSVKVQHREDLIVQFGIP